MNGQSSRPTSDRTSAAALAALLAAVAAEAQPLLAEGRTGRIVINFGGGDNVRIETARFHDVKLRAEGRERRHP